MALYDDIQARLRTSKAKAPIEDDQAAVTAALAAKSGRAADTGPRASSIGQNVAQAANAGAAASNDLAAKAAAEGLATKAAGVAGEASAGAERLASQARQVQSAIAAKGVQGGANRQAAATNFGITQGAESAAATADMTSKFNRATADMAADRGVTEADLFQSFKQGNAELAQRKDAAQLEQLAQTMALSDRAYVDNLNRIGATRRLEDEINYNKETAGLMIDKSLEQLAGNLGFKSVMDQSDREFAEMMASIDADTALSILAKQTQSANTQMIAQGIFTAASKGGDAYYKQNYDENGNAKPSPKPTPPAKEG